MKKKLALLLAAVMILFAFTGCMKFDYGVELNNDGTGSVTLGAYLSEAYFTLAESTPEEVFESTDYSTIEKDGETWYGAEQTTQFATIAELQSVFAEKTSENDDVFPEAMEVYQEIRDGKTYVIFKAAKSESMESDAEEIADMDLSDLKIMELTISVSAPEEVKVIGLKKGVSYSKDKKTASITLDNTMDDADFTIECCLGDVILLPFKDVPKGAWYEPFLKTAYGSGIIAGTSADTYSPGANLTHAQIMVMVANIHKQETRKDVDWTAYSDGSHWASAFREYCKTEGIIDGRFDSRMDAKVTRAEMAYYFANAAGDYAYEKQGPASFWDTEGNAYESEIMKLAEAGIVGGNPDGSFKPENLVSRAEAVVFISNILHLMGVTQ